MDTTTSNLPSTFADTDGDSRGRSTPPFSRIPTSPEPSGIGGKASAFADDLHSAVDAAADAGVDVIARVASDLHEGVDKVEPMASRLEETSRKAADLPLEWANAAREVIREKPLVAISGAVLIGAALLHLLSYARRP